MGSFECMQFNGSVQYIHCLMIWLFANPFVGIILSPNRCRSEICKAERADNYRGFKYLGKALSQTYMHIHIYYMLGLHVDTTHSLIFNFAPTTPSNTVLTNIIYPKWDDFSFVCRNDERHAVCVTLFILSKSLGIVLGLVVNKMGGAKRHVSRCVILRCCDAVC